MKRINIVQLTFLILILTAARSFAAMDIVTVSPWVTVLTHFIGGIKVNITSLTTWDNDRISRTRMRNILSANSTIIALDHSEIKRIGLDENYDNIRYLYENAPFEPSENDKYFGDPSVLPFIAQRLLPVLSSLDPDNYPYYQRRLAEFQTRLSSTILAGRNLLKGQKVLNLTLSHGYFLSAAGCDILKPDEEDMDAWSRYRQMEKLNELVYKSQKENRLVLADATTPKPILAALKSFPNILILQRPPLDQDFLTFLHSQYLMIWNGLKDK
jgi:ABC-type Zn uptake system ZnuABC Zn-binding protein ZnuA